MVRLRGLDTPYDSVVSAALFPIRSPRPGADGGPAGPFGCWDGGRTLSVGEDFPGELVEGDPSRRGHGLSSVELESVARKLVPAEGGAKVVLEVVVVVQ